MKKNELKNEMAVIVKTEHGTFADRVIDIDQAHGIWCERCHLVDEDEIYQPTPESINFIDEYAMTGIEMLG